MKCTFIEIDVYHSKFGLSFWIIGFLNKPPNSSIKENASIYFYQDTYTYTYVLHTNIDTHIFISTQFEMNLTY